VRWGTIASGFFSAAAAASISDRSDDAAVVPKPSVAVVEDATDEKVDVFWKPAKPANPLGLSASLLGSSSDLPSAAEVDGTGEVDADVDADAEKVAPNPPDVEDAPNPELEFELLANAPKPEVGAEAENDPKPPEPLNAAKPPNALPTTLGLVA
jgi:hypothetical protein